MPKLQPCVLAEAMLGVFILAACSSSSEAPADEENGMLDPHRYAALAQHRTNYVCGDEGTFTLIVMGLADEFATVVDGANGLAFNLQAQPVATGKLYGDGVIALRVDGLDAEMTVGGEPRYQDCELRTRHYDCPAGTYFGLETLGVHEDQAIIEDGISRQKFTLERLTDVSGTQYGDGVIRVDLSGAAANVYVDGGHYFADCVLRPV